MAKVDAVFVVKRTAEVDVAVFIKLVWPVLICKNSLRRFRSHIVLFLSFISSDTVNIILLIGL